MKHTLKVTIALVLLFFTAQLAGLFIINEYIDHKATAETKIVTYKPLPYDIERPQVENQSISFIYITIALIIGTLLVLLIVRLNKPFIWRLWFFITVWLTLSISFSPFIGSAAAAATAFIISLLKIYRPNVLIQNFSEIFIYGGLASIFVPMINVFAAFMLLIVISLYDFIAVFKTGHMVRLATFQSQSRIFAGLLIPYRKKMELKQLKQKLPSKPQVKNGQASESLAVLGGGDIGFTLIFAGVVMKQLMLHEAVVIGFLKTLIIPVFASIALLYLLIRGQQNKFYPAMPVLSLGCFIGWIIGFLFLGFYF